MRFTQEHEKLKFGKINNLGAYSLFTNGHQPETNVRPNMESRCSGIKLCFCADFDQLTLKFIGHLKAISLM